MHLRAHPPGDHVPGGEVLDHHPGRGRIIQGVDLDYVPGLSGTILSELAHSVGTLVGLPAHRQAMSYLLVEYATDEYATDLQAGRRPAHPSMWTPAIPDGSAAPPACPGADIAPSTPAPPETARDSTWAVVPFDNDGSWCADPPALSPSAICPTGRPRRLSSKVSTPV